MQSALRSVTDIAKMTAEYMEILEYAPQLKADGLTVFLLTSAMWCWQDILQSAAYSL